MNDVFKKDQSTAAKDDNNEASYEEIANLVDMFAPNCTDKMDDAFSRDIEKFNKECEELVNFVKQCVEKADEENTYFLLLERIGNYLGYGKYGHPFVKIIKLVDNDDLQKVYALIKAEFPDDFVEGCMHTYGEGVSLCPAIGENAGMQIKSDNPHDHEWFYRVYRSMLVNEKNSATKS